MDRAGGSEDDEDRGVMAVTAVTAAATGDRMESDSDSDKSSDNSGLKRKAVALKVGTGRARLPCGGWGPSSSSEAPSGRPLSLPGLSLWFLVHSQSCASVISVSSRTLHHPQKKPHPLWQSPHISTHSP